MRIFYFLLHKNIELKCLWIPEHQGINGNYKDQIVAGALEDDKLSEMETPEMKMTVPKEYIGEKIPKIATKVKKREYTLNPCTEVYRPC